MCGIFALLNHRKSGSPRFSNEILEQAIRKGQSRGPEYSAIAPLDHVNAIFAFHRLKINGLESDKANQPFSYQGIHLICNGEIYNWRSLATEYQIELATGSDCEILLHLYKKIGIHSLLQVIEGEFAFILLDTNQNVLYAVRDPFGIRPLYFAHNSQNVFCFSSEFKMISELQANPNISNFQIEQFEPGTVSTFHYSNNHVLWNHVKTSNYYVIPRVMKGNASLTSVYQAFYNAVKTRVQNTERPVACLLSGGLDSSLVSAVAARIIKESNKVLDTYSIGLAGSEDLYYAKLVADFIGSNHTEIILTEDNFFEAIPEVIYAIESYDTTTVRASIGNYLVSKFISRTSENKVVLCGDGADELMGGYLYFHNCPDASSFELECRRLLKDIHLFDVLRADKSISSNGLEGRVPFLDVNFVEEYLRLPIEERMPNKQCVELIDTLEKAPMRKIAELHKLLPREIIMRHKEAFSDGVTSKAKSLFEILREKIETKYGEQLKTDKSLGNKTIEEKYYFTIFREVFSVVNTTTQQPMFNQNLLDLIPYKWMPNFTSAGETSDPSARTLSIYKKQDRAEYKQEHSLIQKNCVEIQSNVRAQMVAEYGENAPLFVGYNYLSGEYMVC